MLHLTRLLAVACPCVIALPAPPPQDNLMAKDRGPFLFWMLNERAPAAAAAR